MKYFFETYGCQMNNAESAALSLAARERGWIEAASPSEADLILLNTCSVRETAERRVRGRLAHYKAMKKKCIAASPGSRPFSLVIAGCMAQRLGEKLKEAGADYVMGTFARSRFPLILEAVELGLPFVESDEKPVFSFSSLHNDGQESSFRSFVPIMHGCNNFCSYCIVPYVRGGEVSRDPVEILNEIRLLGERGVREITLLGQNVNSYNWKEGSVNFPCLLEMIAKSIDTARDMNSTGVRWVRFLASHPKDLSDDLIRVIAENPCFCRHIHLPVQHGSNRILAAMNRRYTREHYLELVKRLRSAIPDLSLSTDILVGFPGETEEDLEKALDLMDEVKFLYSYMYHFNPREGTAAYSLPDRVDEGVKRQRLLRVIDLQKRHTRELLKSRLGQEAEVLIEGFSRKNADELISRTERDEMLILKRDAGAVGSFCKATLNTLRGNTFRSTK